MKLLICLLSLSVCYSCIDSNSEPPNQASDSSSSTVDIVVQAMQFEAPDTIPSGWVTFRLINNSSMIHFGVLERMPEGKHLADQQRDIAPVFQNIMDGINGKEPSAPDAGTALPDWFADIVFVGGPGFTSPGQTSETTVLVEPGTYLLECYVKSNGFFHSYNPDPEVYGMVHEFYVSTEPSAQSEPQAGVNIDISSAEGFKITGALTPGRQTIAVHFTDQKVYPNFLGHDVHLAQITPNTSIDSLLTWMDWTNPMGLETPAQATFLGGAHDMPAGGTEYFHVNLHPGNYAFIAEVPHADSVGMLTRVTVPEDN